MKRYQGRGFTLVELMVVVGIIGLLIAIVLPSLNAARIQAKVVATSATINVLATGLEQFRADSRLDGEYPPSIHATNANNPHSPVQNGDPPPIEVIGANLVVWALAGADLLGTPGFQNIDLGNAVPPYYRNDIFGGWLGDVGARPYLQTTDIKQLYSLDGNGKPVISRSGPFVDIGRMKFPSQNLTNHTFKIPSAIPTLEGNTGTLKSLCFLDSFNQPILYYKANPRATIASGLSPIADAGGCMNGGTAIQYYATGGQYTPTGIYNLFDNALVTGCVNNPQKGMNLGAGKPLPLTPNSCYHLMGELGDPTNPPLSPTGSFVYQIWNRNVTATPRPYNEDSFLLISAGPDAIFGTADDIANFPIGR